MNKMLLQHLAPFHTMHVAFNAPKRSDFVLHRFKGLWSAAKLMMAAMRERDRIKAETAYNEGLREHSIGRFQRAEECYTLCLNLQPEHEPACVNLAALYLERNSEDLAVALLRRAIQARPYFYRAYYNLGLVFAGNGRTFEAMELFEQALSLNEQHFCSYVALAEVHVRHDNLEAAIDTYLKGKAYCPQPDSLLVRLGELHMKLGRVDVCESLLKESLEIRDSPEIHYNLGWIMAQRGGKLESLIDAFLQAHRGRQDFKEAVFNLALCQSAAGYMEQSVINMVDFVENHTRRTPEELLKHLNLLRLLNPNNHFAGMRIAQLHVDQNQINTAIEVLDSILASERPYVPAVEMLADLYRRLGRFKEAIVTFRRLVEVAPDRMGGYLGLARSYADIENYAAAMPVLEKILELDPKNTQTHYQLATLKAQHGEFALALKHYKIVANLDPNFPRIQKRIKMLEEELEEADASTPKPWPAMLRRPT